MNNYHRLSDMEESTTFYSLDGYRLEGTFRNVPNPKHAILLVHGITVTREEDGFYTEFAKKLDKLSSTSLRFDLRCHGSSEGEYENLTLSGVINDIDAAVKELQKKIPSKIPLTIIATSFGGGLSAYWASEHIDKIHSLVLLNPLLDYGKRMLFDKEFWNDEISDKYIKILNNQGWLPHGDFKMGHNLINELIYIKPYEKIAKLTIPILTIHGNNDKMVSFDIAKKYCKQNNNRTFVEIDGADHGFTSPGDDDLTHTDTTFFRNMVYDKTLRWINEKHDK